MTCNSSKAAAPAELDPYALKVSAEAIRIMFGNLPSIAASVTLMVIVMVWVMWGRADHLTLLVWAACVLLISGAEILLGRNFLQRKSAAQDAIRWGRYYTYISIVSGLSWGSACVLFFVSDSAVLQVFLFTCMVGIATASIIQHSYWLESYYAFTLPLLILSGLRLAWEGGAAYQGLAVLTLVLLVIVIQMAHESQKSVLSAISLRFQNLDLIERLHQEKEKAVIASRDKTRFLASASHDLRQPVHALTLFADALQPELVTDKGKTLLVKIGRSIEAINQLLGSLLDISKLDANIVQAAPLNFNLSDLFIQLDAEYAPQAQAKGLSWQIEASGLVVYSDPALLDNVLRNLISNAIRYTHKGSVKIESFQIDGEVHLKVADSGIGIAEDQQTEIFREFYQIENAERDRTKGLGLGLAIVERVISLLQHRLVMESRLGQGSSFTVVLPAGDRAAVAGQPSPMIVAQHDLAGLKVLILDDEADVRESMRAVMEGWGCAVMLADSLGDAQEKIRIDVPHIIVADYRLRNGMNGVHAINTLRELLGKDLPALVITGDTDPERLREAQASGHALMHKPVQPGKLRSWLRNVRRNKM